MNYLIKIIGILLMFSACNNPKRSSPLPDFNKTTVLNVIDSIDLEELGILNPYNIQYKDSFLIFSTLQGDRELQFLDLYSMFVYVRKVIGQGAGEMPMYSIVKTDNPSSFRFADYRRGKIYEMNLENLRKDSTTMHSLVYELPIESDELLLRFLETENYIYGIGLLKEGRILSFNKKTGAIGRNAAYPADENIRKLDVKHKGALFNRTLMVCDTKHLVMSCFGLVDFYDVSLNGSLILNREYHYFFPKFNSQEYGSPIIFNRDDIYGFSGMDSNARSVYILYSGKNVRNTGEDAFNCPDLFVYDWVGNPIKHFVLSKPLYDFSLCGNLLYGLSRVETPKIYIYSLESCNL